MIRSWIVTIAIAALCGFPAAAAAQTPTDQSADQKCIAVILPIVQGMEGNATELGESVRELFASFLRGPSMRVEALEARLPTHAIAEAKQKNCGPVLSLTITRKRSGGGGSNFLGRVAREVGVTAASNIPGGSTVGTAVARDAARAATRAVADAASTTRAKDEMRIDYTLTSLTGRKELGPRDVKAKASVDGEDLLTPLTQRVAEAVVGAIIR